MTGCATLESEDREIASESRAERVAEALANPWPEPFPEPLELLTIADPLDEVADPLDEPVDKEKAPEGPWERLQASLALPEVDTHHYAHELRRYQNNQAFFDLVTRNGEPYMDHMLDRIEERDLPGELLLVAVIESTLRPFAYSHASAGGLWQFIPATGTRFGLEQNWWYDGRRDVIASTEAALDYLEFLHDYFDGDWLLAFAAYNAGEARVRNAQRANTRRGEPTDFWHLRLPAETRTYVPRILGLRDVIADPDGHGVALPDIDPDAKITVVELDAQMDLAVAAELAGLSTAEIYRYNPGFNRWATPPNGPHRLAVPVKRAEAFETALAEADTRDMLRWERHRVQSGETLSHVARRYGTTVSALRAANEINGNVIRVGQHLVVPIASGSPETYALSEANRRAAAQSRGPAGRQRIEHTVRSGDTLWELAQAHGVSVRQLASWNNMAPGDPLRVGQGLVIWAEGELRTAALNGPGDERVQRVRYTVRPGDSLYRIARRFNVGVSELKRWNSLPPGAVLRPGQRLEVRVDVTAQAGA